MGSVLSKTNEDNRGRVTNINISCFNRKNSDEIKTKNPPSSNDKSLEKSDKFNTTV